MSGPERGRSPRRVQTQIWTLNAGLTAGALVLAGVVSRFGRAGDLSRESATWILIALFAAFELFVVHVRFRDDAHTFSMAEAGIALGLLTAGPTQLIVSQLIGGALVLAIHRRQPVVKLVFNLAQQCLGTSAAILVVHVVLGNGDSLGPRSWFAVALGVAASSMVGTLAILSVLRLATGAVSITGHLGAAAFGLVNSLLSASLGLVGVVMLAARPNATILLAVPAASVFATNLAYVSQRDKHQRLEFLYGATRVLAASQQVEDGLAKLLEHTREALRCDVAALVYRPLDVDDHVVVTTVGNDSERRMETLPREVLGEGWWELSERDGSRSNTPSEFLGSPLVESLVVPLVGETRQVGLLLIARTDTSVNPLSRTDRRMVETLASHLTVTVENGRLEQSLAQLRELERALSYRATHDGLTELANRSLFTDCVTADFAADPRQVGVMFIDLDDFKSVNDTLGHAAGDTLLKETAVRLTATVGDRGMPARLGGDEFAVLLRGDISPSSARRLADAILESFVPTLDIDGREVRIKGTIGIALGPTATDADGLLRNADIAMYAAKAAGKGCHRLFHTQMHDVALHRQDLVERLEGAHDRGEIETFFQPIVDMTTGAPKGAEALVRWVHPIHGVLTPDSFIELAEETGRIQDITRYVLEQACVEAISWDARLDAPTGAYVSVNLSSRDFSDPLLVENIDLTLKDTGLPPQRLLLELTEGMLDDESHVARTIARIRELGVRVAVDDFGTGFSSLSRLRNLTFDVVKIAEPLVAHADRGGRDRDFAQLMVDLARVLGVDAIAEGVETAAQASILRQLGFTAAQGHYYSPALPSPELWSAWRSNAGSRRPVGRDRRAPGGRRAADITLVGRDEMPPAANDA